MPQSTTSRIAVVGAGNVGATAAYALMLRGQFAEIVLIDANVDRDRAEAADIADANAIARPARVRAGDYADTKDAAILVLTAGGVTHGNEDRLSVAGRSAEIVRDCVTQAITAGFEGIVVVAANPVDVMTQVAQAASGLTPARVIGTGTLLDSNRFRKRVAERLEVAPAAVEALVLGEHGDSEVAAFSTVRVGGASLDAFPSGGAVDHAVIADEVRRAGYVINRGKGYTSFGVATAIVRICEAIHRDERVVLPVSTLLDGRYGIANVCLCLPCVIGREGVLRVLEPALNAVELAALGRSAEVLKNALRKVWPGL